MSTENILLIGLIGIICSVGIWLAVRQPKEKRPAPPVYRADESDPF